jgi:hypothetical protein
MKLPNASSARSRAVAAEDTDGLPALDLERDRTQGTSATVRFPEFGDA